MKDRTIDKKVISGLITTLSSLENIVAHPFRRQSANKGSYPYIPLELGAFIASIKDVYQSIRKRKQNPMEYTFIEFGSGVPIKAKIAASIFGDAIGYENNENIIKKVYEDLVLAYYIKKKDLRTISKEDVVTKREKVIAYYYCPFNDRVLEEEFEKKIEEYLPKGSYLIAFLKADYSLEREDSSFKRISYHPVWQKTKN